MTTPDNSTAGTPSEVAAVVAAAAMEVVVPVAFGMTPDPDHSSDRGDHPVDSDRESDMSDSDIEARRAAARKDCEERAQQRGQGPELGGPELGGRERGLYERRTY